MHSATYHIFWVSSYSKPDSDLRSDIIFIKEIIGLIPSCAQSSKTTIKQYITLIIWYTSRKVSKVIKHSKLKEWTEGFEDEVNQVNTTATSIIDPPCID